MKEEAQGLAEQEVVIHEGAGKFGLVIDEVGGVEDGLQNQVGNGHGRTRGKRGEAGDKVIVLVDGGGLEKGGHDDGVAPEEGGRGGFKMAFAVGGEPGVGGGEGAVGEVV